MPLVAFIALEHNGQRIPLAKTRQRAVLRAVARAALADIHATRETVTDATIDLLLEGEADHLARIFSELGLAP